MRGDLQWSGCAVSGRWLQIVMSLVVNSFLISHPTFQVHHMTASGAIVGILLQVITAYRWQWGVVMIMARDGRLDGDALVHTKLRLIHD